MELLLLKKKHIKNMFLKKYKKILKKGIAK